MARRRAPRSRRGSLLGTAGIAGLVALLGLLRGVQGAGPARPVLDLKTVGKQYPGLRLPALRGGAAPTPGTTIVLSGAKLRAGSRVLAFMAGERLFPVGWKIQDPWIKPLVRILRGARNTSTPLLLVSAGLKVGSLEHVLASVTRAGVSRAQLGFVVGSQDQRLGAVTVKVGQPPVRGRKPVGPKAGAAAGTVSAAGGRQLPVLRTGRGVGAVRGATAPGEAGRARPTVSSTAEVRAVSERLRRICYAPVVTRMARAGRKVVPHGRVRFGLQLERTGWVLKQKVLHSAFFSRKILGCTRKILGRNRFKPSATRRVLTFEVVFMPPQAELAWKKVRRVIRAGKAGINGCYQQTLDYYSLHHPDRAPPTGLVRFRIRVQAGTGKVIGLGVLTDRLNCSRLVRCVKSVILGWRFPPPSGVGSYVFSYPLRFKPVPRKVPGGKGSRRNPASGLRRRLSTVHGLPFLLPVSPLCAAATGGKGRDVVDQGRSLSKESASKSGMVVNRTGRAGSRTAVRVTLMEGGCVVTATRGGQRRTWRIPQERGEVPWSNAAARVRAVVRKAGSRAGIGLRVHRAVSYDQLVRFLRAVEGAGVTTLTVGRGPSSP